MPPKKIQEKKTKNKKKAELPIASANSLYAASLKPIAPLLQPYDIREECDYLARILQETVPQTITYHLRNFSINFPVTEPVIKNILKNYPQVEDILYILRIFLRQYTLTLGEFNDKFLLDPAEFNALKQFRELMYNSIIERKNKEYFKAKIKLFLKNYKKDKAVLKDLFRDPQIYKFLKDLVLDKSFKYHTMTVENVKDIFNIFKASFPEYVNIYTISDSMSQRLLYSLMKFFISSGNRPADEFNFDKIKLQLSNFKELYPQYSQMINNILEEFDAKLLYKFAREFINQGYLTPFELYDQFINDVSNKIILKSTKNNLDFNLGAFESKFMINKSMGEKLAITIADKDCVFSYTQVPWLADKVENIYICPVDTDIYCYTYSKDKINLFGTEWFKVNKYYYELQCDPNLLKEQKGDVLSFFDKNTKQLIANFKIGYEVSRNRVVPVENKNYNIYSFENLSGKNMVKRNIIVQNEFIFEKEKKYFAEKNKTPKDKIKSITEESVNPVKPDVVKIAIKFMKTYFKNTDNEDLANDEYLNKVIDEILKISSNVSDFAKKLGELLVYMSKSVDAFNYGLFKSKIKLKYYPPEDIVKLTEKEKLPEVFGDGFLTGTSEENEKIRESMRSNLKESLDEFIENFIDELYIHRNMYGRYKPRSSLKYGDRFRYSKISQLPDLTKTCIGNPGEKIKTKDLINYLPLKDKHIIKVHVRVVDPDNQYAVEKILPNGDIEKVMVNKTKIVEQEKEVDSIFCLNIDEIYERLQNKNNTNPYTGNELPPEFIDRVNNAVTERKARVIITTSEPSTVSNLTTAPSIGLLRLIRSDINRLIDREFKVKETEEVTKTKEEAPITEMAIEPSMLVETEAVIEPEEVVEYVDFDSFLNGMMIEEQPRVEIPVAEIPIDLGILQIEEPIVVEEFPKDGTTSEEANEIESEEQDGGVVLTCQRCNTNIKGKPFKTTICQNDELAIVNFCSIGCIDEFNFKKYKMKDEYRGSKKIKKKKKHT